MSFDRRLFEKELNKAIGQLNRTECLQLKFWCQDQFGDEFQPIISMAFAKNSFQFKTELTD